MANGSHKLSWSQLKAFVTGNKRLKITFTETDHVYTVFSNDEGIQYICTIHKTSPAGSDQTDFETNFKDDANTPFKPIDDDGKNFVRSESRPVGTSVCFVGAGDDPDEGIGEGKDLSWDFSNNEDEVDAPSGFKRKRIELRFLDVVYLKEGTCYFHNAPKGCHVDVYVVAKAGAYYKKNDGSYSIAQTDLPVAHYVIKHKMQGNCPMGDELNTETSSEGFPTNYRVWIEVTTPSDDDVSNGYILLEMYRSRTCIL